jgi:hypothetical protein
MRGPQEQRKLTHEPRGVGGRYSAAALLSAFTPPLPLTGLTLKDDSATQGSAATRIVRILTSLEIGYSSRQCSS